MLLDHPLWFVYLKFTGLPAPVQGGILSALISTSIAILVFTLGYVHTTRPILVFVRRPDNFWRIFNIGKGAAFDIRFEDRLGDKYKRVRIYPIAEKETVELGPLDHGGKLTLYYATRSGKRRYETYCHNWDHHFRRLRWREKFPDWGNIPDETRLTRTPPEFDVKFQPGQPDCHRVRLDAHVEDRSLGVAIMRVVSAETHFVRARIQNTGKVGAEDVEVSVVAVRHRTVGGVFELMPMGTPWNLTWAHIRSHVLPRLPVDSQRHIDLGHVVDPAKRALMPGEDRPGSDAARTLYCLAFFVKSNTYEYLLGPGEYEIDFRIFSANARTSSIFTLHLNHTGNWFEDEGRMFHDGLGLQITKGR